MSRTWITCHFCREQFAWTTDPVEPHDVCDDCSNRIDTIASQRAKHERTRLRTALLEAAKGLGDEARAAVETIAEALNEA